MTHDHIFSRCFVPNDLKPKHFKCQVQSVSLKINQLSFFLSDNPSKTYRVTKIGSLLITSGMERATNCHNHSAYVAMALTYTHTQ